MTTSLLPRKLQLLLPRKLLFSSEIDGEFDYDPVLGLMRHNRTEVVLGAAPTSSGMAQTIFC